METEKESTPEYVKKPPEVKPLDLSNTLRHAFLSGRGVAETLTGADQKAWADYDPDDLNCYKRIMAALDYLRELKHGLASWSVYDWEYVHPITRVPMYARTPEKAEKLLSEGVTLTPVFIPDKVIPHKYNWEHQKWMAPDQKMRWDSHDEAMNLIRNTGTVTVLSYEEAVLIYLRARGILRDDSETMGDPIKIDS